MNPNSSVPKIKFHVYKILSRCIIHVDLLIKEGNKCENHINISEDSQRGKMYTKKELIMLEELIDVFHKVHYQPSITKLAYHLSHVSILGAKYVG